MKAVYFVTGNDGKFREAKALLPGLERVNFDLPEEQTLDPHVVIRKKLDAARTRHQGQLIVEDTSLYLEGMNGFPGPLIKWMLQAVGTQGIYDLTSAIKNFQAVAKTVVGFDDGQGNVTFFEGRIDGRIVAPVGADGFGWDAIFKPDGADETFAQMGTDLKRDISMRTLAFKQLRDYLQRS